MGREWCRCEAYVHVTLPPSKTGRWFIRYRLYSKRDRKLSTVSALKFQFSAWMQTRQGGDRREVLGAAAVQQPLDIAVRDCVLDFWRQRGERFACGTD